MEQAGYQIPVIPESMLGHLAQCVSALSQSLDDSLSLVGVGVEGRDLTGALLVGQKAHIETHPAALPFTSVLYGCKT